MLSNDNKVNIGRHTSRHQCSLSRNPPGHSATIVYEFSGCLWHESTQNLGMEAFLTVAHPAQGFSAICRQQTKNSGQKMPSVWCIGKVFHTIYKLQPELALYQRAVTHRKSIPPVLATTEAQTTYLHRTELCWWFVTRDMAANNSHVIADGVPINAGGLCWRCHAEQSLQEHLAACGLMAVLEQAVG